MAENRSGTGPGRAGEPGFDEERAFDLGKNEAHMPPRNILETDSAKYTAEFVKGVVKGLYTADTDSYEMRNSSEYEFGGVSEELEDSIEPPPPRRERRIPPPTRQEPKNEPYSEPEPKVGPRVLKRGARESGAAPTEELPAFLNERRPAKRDGSFNMSEDEVLAADGFLKAYEEKNHSEKPSFAKKPARRTFSSLNSDESVSSLEGVLSGKPQKRFEAAGRGKAVPDDEEEYVYIKPETARKRAPLPETTNLPEGDAVYRKISHGGPEIEEKDGFTSVPAYEQVEPRQQEKIPIIINRNIEGKPRKTADDYRNISKPEYDRNPRRSEPYASSAAPGKGVKVIMAAFMFAAVIIIGLLVWKINSLSGGESRYDADEITSLKEENSLLKKENNELETKYNALLSENENLREENVRLTSAAASAPEEPEEPEEQNPESAQPANGLVDGYYTVKSGDNLWSIAQEFLGDGDQYLKIATANGLDPTQSLYAGLRIKIPTQ